MYLVSAVILVFNALLHTLFGKELFLYTQHWIVPLCLVLVPLLSGKYLRSTALLLSLVVVNVHFMLNVEQLVELRFVPPY